MRRELYSLKLSYRMVVKGQQGASVSSYRLLSRQ